MNAYIICTGTHGRAVVFGYSENEPEEGKPFRMSRMRMVLRWDAECGGLFGLAAGGPKADTRLTAEVPIGGGDDVKQWIAVPEEAAELISAWPAWTP